MISFSHDVTVTFTPLPGSPTTELMGLGFASKRKITRVPYAKWHVWKRNCFCRRQANANLNFIRHRPHQTGGFWWEVGGIPLGGRQWSWNHHLDLWERKWWTTGEIFTWSGMSGMKTIDSAVQKLHLHMLLGTCYTTLPNEQRTSDSPVGARNPSKIRYPFNMVLVLIDSRIQKGKVIQHYPTFSCIYIQVGQTTH